MCTEGRNCIVNEKVAVSGTAIEMQKRHGYGGNFECKRYGGDDGFEFRITIESDGDITTDDWTNTCTTTTSTTITTTTLPECDAGFMLDISANACINCPRGQYQSQSNHQYG